MAKLNFNTIEINQSLKLEIENIKVEVKAKNEYNDKLFQQNQSKINEQIKKMSEIIVKKES